MKACASCKNAQACAKAGKCAATVKPLKPAPMHAGQKKTGRFYIQRVD